MTQTQRKAQLKPSTTAARVGKPGGRPARKARQCRACLAEAELAADGLCKDRQACASRIAPLLPELPL